MLSAPMWVLWLGMAGSFVAGLCLRWWASAHRFERRNELGVEVYSSYGDLMSSRFFEKVANLLGGLFLAVALVFVLAVAARMMMAW